jgi:post-segregation antitoxin (ccd killing protein)
MRMPRANAYLPDDLAAQIRPLGLNLSSVLQGALRERLDALRVEAWLSELERLPAVGPGPGTAREALDDVQRVGGG